MRPHLYYNSEIDALYIYHPSNGKLVLINDYGRERTSILDINSSEFGWMFEFLGLL